jgi:hypothetical protein
VAEVLASLRRVGVVSMDIYLLGRRLVMVVDTEGRDYRHCFAEHATSNPRVIEWKRSCARSSSRPPAPRPASGGRNASRSFTPLCSMMT